MGQTSPGVTLDICKFNPSIEESREWATLRSQAVGLDPREGGEDRTYLKCWLGAPAMPSSKEPGSRAECLCSTDEFLQTEPPEEGAGRFRHWVIAIALKN